MVFLSKALSGIDDRTLSDMYDKTVATVDTLAAIQGQQVAVYNRVNELLEVTGEWLTDLENQWTVRGGLWQIYKLLREISTGVAAIAGGIPPFEVDRQYSSAGVKTINTESGYRTYALWPDAPDGTTADAERINLTPDTEWVGWRAYVQTDSGTPWENDSAVPAQAWYSLSGAASTNWSVESGRGITVYLQAPNLEYISLSSVSVDGFYRIEFPAEWRGNTPPTYIMNLAEGQALDVTGAHSQGQAAVIWETGSSDVPKSGAVVTVLGPKTGVQIVRDVAYGPYNCNARVRG
jgi:hypothetical protein